MLVWYNVKSSKIVLNLLISVIWNSKQEMFSNKLETSYDKIWIREKM